MSTELTSNNGYQYNDHNDNGTQEKVKDCRITLFNTGNLLFTKSITRFKNLTSIDMNAIHNKLRLDCKMPRLNYNNYYCVSIPS